MKILFIGADSGTSRHRARGFERLGHKVRLVDPRSLLPKTSVMDRLAWKVHPAPLALLVRARMLRALGAESFDLAFVDGGSLVGPGLVRDLKARGMRVVGFNHDDPFGPRDGGRFATYRAAVPFYDLVVVVRDENVAEAKGLGALRILQSHMVADDVAHIPRCITPEICRHWASDVAFVGTWMPERGLFLAQLLQLGVPLSIFGSRWEKAPEWPLLRRALRTQFLEGDEYCYAIQCAKICLGLLSIGNRDQYTTRSMEIPALGSVLCAQRTAEHQRLYEEGREAVFWDTADQCAEICAELLHDDAQRQKIAQLGRVRCLVNGHFTEQFLTRVIDAAFP